MFGVVLSQTPTRRTDHRPLSLPHTLQVRQRKICGASKLTRNG